jgi:hypothetical protein
MRWVKWTGKAVEFAGKLVQADSFEKWADSQLEAVLEKVALEEGIKAFKKGAGQDYHLERSGKAIREDSDFFNRDSNGSSKFPYSFVRLH